MAKKLNSCLTNLVTRKIDSCIGFKKEQQVSIHNGIINLYISKNLKKGRQNSELTSNIKHKLCKWDK